MEAKLGSLLLLMPLAGCLAAPTGLPPLLDAPLATVDPSLYQDFHATEAIAERLHRWSRDHPGWVRVESIGQSIEGRDIWAATLTNPLTPGPKRVAFIDGGHHANELEGIESVLYTGDFLLSNLRNLTVQAILAESEVLLVPLVNPDGHAAAPQTRGNALGVNLNRNYDIDWGNPAGANNAVMGTLAHSTGQPMPSVSIVAENSGDAPFSEPETRAVRDLMERVGPRMAFYLTFHTDAHSVIVPWTAQDPPFRIPPEHEAFFQRELAWVREHTEYLAGRASWGQLEAGLPYSASGISQDWAYAMWRVPAFTFEQSFGATAAMSEDYAGRMQAPDPGLEYWMRAGLPFTWHLLVNSASAQRWEPAERDVPLPEGVPPEPPAGLRGAGLLRGP